VAEPHRNRLARGAALAAGACAAVAVVVLVVVLRSPMKVPADNDRAAAPTAASDSAATPRPAAAASSQNPAAPTPAEQKVAAANIAATDTLPRSEANAASITGTPPPPDDRPGRRGLVVLQIGDSHTAADFFSGEVRRRLQQRYGNGGVGYITAGKPHAGVRSAALKVMATSGWTYRAIQHSDNPAEFWLSGFNAVASVSGEVLTFTSDSTLVFDSVEIETLRQPDGGSINIVMDGVVKRSYDLNGKTVEPMVLRLSPDGAPNDRVRQIEIRTQSAGTVSIGSLAIYNKQSGVSYNSIGYPGATVDILNRFDQKLMADDLRRLDPQIVVLAFGTNEAAKVNLDPARYEQNYEKAIGKIKAALPNVKIVLIGPPDGAERSSHCAGKPGAEAACHATASAEAPPANASAAAPEAADCDWHTLPKLEMVRAVERKIADQHGFTYWNWASIMPPECGAHVWATASPPLMTPDHVHFTVAGYNKSAEQFLNALIPVIESLQVRPNIAANN
jgi:lysophospholipase L1-like esterase